LTFEKVGKLTKQSNNNITKSLRWTYEASYVHIYVHHIHWAVCYVLFTRGTYNVHYFWRYYFVQFIFSLWIYVFYST